MLSPSISKDLGVLEIKPIENSKHSNFKGCNDSCRINIYKWAAPSPETQPLACLSPQLSFIYIDYVLKNICCNTAPRSPGIPRPQLQQSSVLQHRPPK